MSVLGRAHTIAAVALMALIPLAPAGLWAYARLASVDRGDVVGKNERVLRSVPHLPGAQSIGGTSYALYRWDVEGSLVPIDGYRTEFVLRLPRAVRPDAIVAHYVRVLRGWRADLEPVDCSILGLPGGCGAATATFTRGGVTIDVEITETLLRPQHAKEYGFYVSQ